MTINLPKDLEERARAKVDAGEYPDVTEVLRAGLEALELLDEAPEEAAWVDTARQVFEDGRAAVARSEYFQGSPADIMARARVRVENRVKRT